MTRGEAEGWSARAARAGFEKSPHRGWMLRLLERVARGEALPLTAEQMLRRGLHNTLGIYAP